MHRLQIFQDANYIFLSFFPREPTSTARYVASRATTVFYAMQIHVYFGRK